MQAMLCENWPQRCFLIFLETRRASSFFPPIHSTKTPRDDDDDDDDEGLFRLAKPKGHIYMVSIPPVHVM
jgi:hypothetical protein